MTLIFFPANRKLRLGILSASVSSTHAASPEEIQNALDSTQRPGIQPIPKDLTRESAASPWIRLKMWTPATESSHETHVESLPDAVEYLKSFARYHSNWLLEFISQQPEPEPTGRDATIAHAAAFTGRTPEETAASMASIEQAFRHPALSILPPGSDIALTEEELPEPDPLPSLLEGLTYPKDGKKIHFYTSQLPEVLAALFAPEDQNLDQDEVDRHRYHLATKRFDDLRRFARQHLLGPSVDEELIRTILSFSPFRRMAYNRLSVEELIAAVMGSILTHSAAENAKALEKEVTASPGFNAANIFLRPENPDEHKEIIELLMATREKLGTTDEQRNSRLLRLMDAACVFHQNGLQLLRAIRRFQSAGYSGESCVSAVLEHLRGPDY